MIALRFSSEWVSGENIYTRKGLLKDIGAKQVLIMVREIRFLLDTNIYAEILKDDRGDKLVEIIVADKNFIIHGFELIRKELRKIPKDHTLNAKNLRIGLLDLYDNIIKGKEIQETKEIKNLAENYFKTYQKQGGILNKTHIINDLKIVACASVKEMDIICSNDKKTLNSDHLTKIYNQVNLKENIRTPQFIDYEALKKSKL